MAVRHQASGINLDRIVSSGVGRGRARANYLGKLRIFCHLPTTVNIGVLAATRNQSRPPYHSVCKRVAAGDTMIQKVDEIYSTEYQTAGDFLKMLNLSLKELDKSDDLKFVIP